MQVGKFDDAVAAFSKCVQLLPNRAEPLLNLALAYKSKGMEVEAAAAYQRASQLSQKHP
jgi:Flp pilus assembly protein TadD